MGLFGFGTKRKPLAERAMSRPNASSGAPTRPSSIAARRADQQAGVEVSEFNLDEDDFSTIFGAASTQFSDALEDDPKADPWSARRRLD